jgi:hypothetical protein
MPIRYQEDAETFPVLAWVILGVDGMRHAVSALQLSRIFEKPIAVRAIQKASREASGPLSQFSPRGL